MHARFYAPDLSPDHPRVVLPADEAEHLTRVLRMGLGDEVTVFDGRGNEFVGRIASVSREGVSIETIGRAPATAESGVAITLAQAVLKGDKMEDIVRDATMMGVRWIRPVVSERTALSLPALTRAHRAERWRRVAIASAKQCRRAVVPDICAPIALTALIAVADHDLNLLLVEPGEGQECWPLERLSQRDRPATAQLLVGPEGGWSDEERDAAIAAGWFPVTLGRRTLRADATPIVALSVLQYVWGDL